MNNLEGKGLGGATLRDVHLKNFQGYPHITPPREKSNLQKLFLDFMITLNRVSSTIKANFIQNLSHLSFNVIFNSVFPLNYMHLPQKKTKPDSHPYFMLSLHCLETLTKDGSCHFKQCTLFFIIAPYSVEANREQTVG